MTDNTVISKIYNIAKQVSEGTLQRKEGLELAIRNGIDGDFMAVCIYVFSHLRDGTEFTRNLSAGDCDAFLNNIYLDYGYEGLSNALKAFNKHIIYYESKRNVTMKKLRSIYNKYDAYIPDKIDTDEEEQAELIKEIKEQRKSPQEILDELQNAPEIEPEKIEFKGKSYKRENYNIAKIKLLRGSKCQICNTSIIKKDKTEYIEAAHITPKREKGRETLENIILLCPNHHKEFDLGDRIEINRTKSDYQCSLNGKVYNISLEPSLT